MHTKDGAKITAHCIWGADAKTRKLIVRSFKPYVTKVCTEEVSPRFCITVSALHAASLPVVRSRLYPRWAEVYVPVAIFRMDTAR